MSENFHKSCYTSRCAGYKYRTLSTNTGDKTSRDSKEDNIFDRKFKELRTAITSRINKQVTDTKSARESIKVKIDKIDAKITSMLELKEAVAMLKKDLQSAEIALETMVDTVERLESIVGVSEVSSVQSRRGSFITRKMPY
ncbi:unnamed protein product [Leptidea sinapis]|uniref:Uncharacterized protein n=1 Tax=Leptidea sinapis TaxID=189913 RepID=A0A5E4QZW5_9NEOP|nr:unnamed protein product [Leptidea sinapis]